MTKAPGGLSALSPHIVVDGADAAIEFYRRAFGAEEISRIPGPDGRLVHAALSIAGSTLLLMDENPACGALAPTPGAPSAVTLHLVVPDADATAHRAAAAGATVVMEVGDMPWGDRYGVLRDPFGHSWSVATTVRPMTDGEIRAAVAKAMAEA
jgi:PhnB protein